MTGTYDHERLVERTVTTLRESLGVVCAIASLSVGCMTYGMATWGSTTPWVLMFVSSMSVFPSFCVAITHLWLWQDIFANQNWSWKEMMQCHAFHMTWLYTFAIRHCLGVGV